MGIVGTERGVVWRGGFEVARPKGAQKWRGAWAKTARSVALVDFGESLEVLKVSEGPTGHGWSFTAGVRERREARSDVTGGGGASADHELSHQNGVLRCGLGCGHTAMHTMVPPQHGHLSRSRPVSRR